MKQRIRIHKAEPNTGALNFAHLLDAPAGKHGFVQARNGHLYFEDGTRARFIGFNVPTRSNTPDHETAERMAERFASMGVNVIRLHAADAPIGASGWSSCKDSPLLDYESGSTRHFHPEGLDRFDYFVAKLKERGIYLHIDLMVARAFQEGDGLAYPNAPGFAFKCFSMVNERLIELQKEYAKALLCHVNPYTGLALIDDPAVMTIQINNEDSVLKGTAEIKDIPSIQPYRAELQQRFNHYLLMKYHTRAQLEKAWTFEGCCALGPDEDPTQGTVRIAEGDFIQPVVHPMGDWDAELSPARYADYLEFAMGLNRQFYRTMIDFVRGLGAKVPIVTSNLLGGAADAFSHADGDLMENNCYFNHPLLPVENGVFKVAGPIEQVSVNPLTMQQNGMNLFMTLPVMASLAVIGGKPFVISEWNEYGLHPFHSTAFLSMVAYACLQDWDGLILYCHHTSEKWDDQPADEILDVFDAYNDPALICQFGFLASMFLKGLVKPAAHWVEVAFTENDLRTLPPCHAMPYTYLAYVTGMRNILLPPGDSYTGDADVVLCAGFLNGGDLSQARHAVYYAWSPYRDALRRVKDEHRLQRIAGDAPEVAPGITLDESTLVFHDINAVAGNGDYRGFAEHLDRALKQWGVLAENCGLVDGCLRSDTGELTLDSANARFEIRTPYCRSFSGAPTPEIMLTDDISVQVHNERITLTLLPIAEENTLAQAEAYVFTALGSTGMDETTYTPAGFFTDVVLRGKLYADTLEGTLCVRCRAATLTALDPVGKPICDLKGTPTPEGIEFQLDGKIPAVQFLLHVTR